MNKWAIILLLFLTIPQLAFGQDKKIDQLEVFYSQKHFTKVLRKANKLLAIPDYDYSGMPTFYKSLATFKLLSNQDWLKKNKNALPEAITLYNEFLQHSKNTAYINSHYFEISELKQFLIKLEEQLRAEKRTLEAKSIDSFIEIQLKNITTYGIKTTEPVKLPKKQKNKGKDLAKEPKNSANSVSSSNNELREEMVIFASQFIGTPYQWAGNSPTGFDCSGYIGYVYNNYGIAMPRTASAQKLKAIKVNDSEAMKGDLVFFKSGNKITHVGIVISELGQPLTMLHSSSSKGIIKTEVHSSTYWSKKFAGVGRIIT